MFTRTLPGVLPDFMFKHYDWSFYLIVGDLQVVVRVACFKFILDV